MTFFDSNPFSKILGFWLLGLITALYFPLANWLIILLWSYFGILALAKIKSRKFPFDLHVSAFYAFSLTLIAFASASFPKAIPKSKDEKVHFLATVLELPTEKPNSYQCLLKIDCCEQTDFNKQKILAYFEKDEKADSLLPGDQLALACQLRRIQSTNVPFAFDYQKYMAGQNIYFSAYVPAKNYDLIGTNQKSILINAERFRTLLIRRLKKYVPNQESAQIISALTLGYRKELSTETKTYFASTGAMHVLAVSGLHVGMIYLFLTSILAFLKRKKTGRVIYFALVAGFLWGYALLTGFSPSVQRATVMFCFLLVGSSLRRPASIYSSIAASAFLLLLVNPKLIAEPGFQLSYAAVVSIVFFYPRLGKLLSPKTIVLSKLWQLFCVSLAAQIGTFALSIFYFHQFPVYFWLSNLVVIPAAYFILAFTFLFFITSFSSTLSVFIGGILSAITWGTTEALRFIDRLPFSLIENLSISLSQLLILLAILVVTAFFMKMKRPVFFLLTGIFILLFLAVGLVEKANHFNQKKIIYYQRDQELHLINGRKNYLIYQHQRPENKLQIKNTIRELKLAPPIYICLDSCQQFFSEDLFIEKQNIQFLDQTFQYDECKENQQQMIRQNAKKSRFPVFSDLDLTQKAKINSALEKGRIINLCDL